MSRRGKCKLYANLTSTVVNIAALKKKDLRGEVFESGASGVCTKDSFQGLLLNLSESGGEKPQNISTLYYKRTQIEQFASNDRKSDFSERCGPPENVSFRRLGGRIAVNVTWQPDEMMWIKHFNVTYRAQGSPGGSEVRPFTPSCLCLPPL